MVAVQTLTVRVGGDDYHLRALRDRLEEADPLFGVLWPASMALAERMAAYPVAGKRILEAGCGLALPSVVLKKRGADITATDHHPLVEEFLNLNLEMNGLPQLPFKRADWTDADLGRFDLIIGADILYEPDHPAQLAAFLERHAAPGAEIMIADPGRRQLSQFRKRMAARYPRCTETRFPPRGRLLTFA